MEPLPRITGEYIEHCVLAKISSELLIGNGNFEEYMFRLYKQPHCEGAMPGKPAYLSIWVQHATHSIQLGIHESARPPILCMYGDTKTQQFMRIVNYDNSHHMLILNTIRDEKENTIMEFVNGDMVNQDIIQRPNCKTRLAEIFLETEKTNLTSKKVVEVRFNTEVNSDGGEKLLVLMLAFKTTCTKYRAIIQPQKIIPPSDLSDMEVLKGINQFYIFKESYAYGKNHYLSGYFRFCRSDGSPLPLYFETITNRRDGCPMRLMTDAGDILLTIVALMPWSSITTVYCSDRMEIGTIKEDSIKCNRLHVTERDLKGFPTANENESYTVKYAQYHITIGKIICERMASNPSRVWIDVQAAVDDVQKALILAYAMKKALLQFQIHTERAALSTRPLSEPIDVDRFLHPEKYVPLKNPNYPAPKRYSIQREEFYRSQGASFSSALETLSLESPTTTPPSQTSPPLISANIPPSQSSIPSRPVPPSQPTPASQSTPVSQPTPASQSSPQFISADTPIASLENKENGNYEDKQE